MSSTIGSTLLDQIVPRLRHTVPHSVRCIGAEDASELLQDATAMAARMLAACEAGGKSVTPGNIAYYTLLHLRDGRRFHASGRSDALGSRTQLCGRSRVSSLDEPVGHPVEPGEEPLTLGDVLASDAEDPATTAARNLDWQALMAALDERTLAVLRCLAGEIRLLELATRHGVCRTTVQTWRDQLTARVREFMGADALRELQRAPVWREGLRALREQVACRLERRAA